MRYIWHHIAVILENYKGEIPLAPYLKNYFKQYPKLGSRDRKLLSAMAYCWYRCVNGIEIKHPSITELSIEAKLRWCLQMCNIPIPPTLAMESNDTNPEISFIAEKLFPFEIALSDGIMKTDWLHSMLTQPDLFIRVRKDKNKIINILEKEKIPFTIIGSNGISLTNGAKINDLLPEDAYVIQDASSQQTGTFFRPLKNEQWYDCCAGAGGKSLLLKDLETTVKLTVSDTRESILHNLLQRFRLCNHQLPISFNTDVADKKQLDMALAGKLYDHIICDAPCSGSGTWSRTPEQLYFFNPLSLASFSARQKSIALNVSHHLKPGGSLFYITCSVFREENEGVVEYLTQESGLDLVKAQLINGIALKADNMFIAVLRKRGQA